MKNMFFLLSVLICRHHANLYNSDVNKEEQYSLLQDDLHQLYGQNMPTSLFDSPNDSSDKSSNSSYQSNDSSDESSDNSYESSDSNDEEKIYEKIVGYVRAFKASNMDRCNGGKKLLSLQLPKPDLKLKGLLRKTIDLKSYSFFNALPISFGETKTKDQMIVGWCPEPMCSFAVALECESKIASRIKSHIASIHHNFTEYDIDYLKTHEVCWNRNEKSPKYFFADLPISNQCYTATKSSQNKTCQGFAYPCQAPYCEKIIFNEQKANLITKVKQHNITHLNALLQQTWHNLDKELKDGETISCENCLKYLRTNQQANFNQHCVRIHVSYNENL